MSKKKKIIISIVSVILGLALILGVFYLITPRTFLQLFLSDSKYTGVVLAKNMKALEKIDNLQCEGGIRIDIDDEYADYFAEYADIIDYAENVKFKINSSSDGENEYGILDISDADGSLATLKMYTGEDNIYATISNIDCPWINIDLEDLEDEMYDYDDSNAIDISDKIKVDGDKITIKMTTKQLARGIASDLIPTETLETINATIIPLGTSLQYEFSAVKIEITVDNRNNITNAKLVFESEYDSDIVCELTVEDESAKLEFRYDIDEVGIKLAFTFKEGKDVSFSKPSEKDAVSVDEVDGNALGEAAINYYLSEDFINTHSTLFGLIEYYAGGVEYLFY